MAIFNATHPGGLDGWTMDARQYELLRETVLELVDALAGPDGTTLLKDVVAAGQERLGDHELFPRGRLRTSLTYTKVDPEARGELERVARSSPQRLRVRQISAPGRSHPVSRRT